MTNNNKKCFTVPYCVTAHWSEGDKMPEDSTPEEIKERCRYIKGEEFVEAVDESEAWDEVVDTWENDECRIVDYSDIAGAYITELDSDGEITVEE